MKNWFAVEVSLVSGPSAKVRGSDPNILSARQPPCKCSDFAPSRFPWLIRVSYAIVGVVLVGAGWYLTRLARGPSGTSHSSCLFPVHTSDLPRSRLDEGEPDSLELYQTRRGHQAHRRESTLRQKVRFPGSRCLDEHVC